MKIGVDVVLGKIFLQDMVKRLMQHFGKTLSDHIGKTFDSACEIKAILTATDSTANIRLQLKFAV